MGIVPCNSPGIATHQNSETKISSQIILSDELYVRLLWYQVEYVTDSKLSSLYIYTQLYTHWLPFISSTHNYIHIYLHNVIEKI